MTTLIILGCIAAVLGALALFLRRSAPPMEYADADWEYYEDEDEDEWREEAPAPSTRFQPGLMYTWEPIEDLLWAYGYTRGEVHAAWEYNYVSICRDGLRAEFDGSLFATDGQGNQLYACHQFDTQADTYQSDRWRRQPTDSERRQAVWR